MRLIDANLAIERQWFNNAQPLIYRQYAVDVLRDAPTVDAVEVVHGRWEDDGTCSNCKGLNPTYRANKWSAEFPDFPGHFDHLNYCPN